MEVAARSRRWIQARRWICGAGALFSCALLVGVELFAEENPPSLAIQPGKSGTQPGKGKEKPRDELVTAQAYLSVDKLPAGRTCKIVVLLDVREGWHINQNPPDPEHLLPTKFSVKSKYRTSLSDVVYPEGQPLKVAGMNDSLMVYENQVEIRGVVSIPKEAAGKTEELELVVDYQACNDKTCKAPTKIKLGGKIPVAGPNDTVKEINQNLFPKERS